jgi:hypothetical protein
MQNTQLKSSRHAKREQDSVAVLLVARRGTRLDVTQKRHFHDLRRLFDDTQGAASVAAKPGLRNVRTDRARRHFRVRDIWQTRKDVRRSAVVHVQDLSSLGAVFVAVWAWLYHRALVIGSSAEPTLHLLSRRRQRATMFDLFLRIPLARSASRVIVPDTEWRNRMLAKNVEPSRIELKRPNVELADFYEGVYEQASASAEAGPTPVQATADRVTARSRGSQGGRNSAPVRRGRHTKGRKSPRAISVLLFAPPR